MSVCLFFSTLFLLKPLGLNLELLVLPAVGMYMIVYEVGIGPIRWMVASEMFPVQFRGISNAISSSTLLTSIFIVGFVFPTVQDLLGKYVFLLFGVVSFFSAIYSAVRNSTFSMKKGWFFNFFFDIPGEEFQDEVFCGHKSLTICL